MPKRKRYSRRRYAGVRKIRKRTRFSRRRSKNFKNRLTYCKIKGQPIPDTTFIKLRDFDAVRTSGSVGTQASVIYRPFGMYDPRYAIGGGQPQYFDQWMGLYERYIVYGSKISATVTITQAAHTQLYVIIVPIVGAINSDYLIPGTPNSSPTQLPGARWKTIKSTGDRSTVTVKNYCSLRKLTGIRDTNNLISGQGYYGTDSTNPTSDIRWYILVWDPLFDVTSQTAFDISVNMKFYAKLFRRRHVIDS